MKTRDDLRKSIERYFPSAKGGLSSVQVRERREKGLVNKQKKVLSKSYTYIVLDNLCTLFNLINAVLAAAVIWSGSYKNLLFMGVVILNLFIGVFQEIRAKRAVDKLTLVYSAKSTVVREGREERISTSDIVLDDIILFAAGDQIPVDCVLISGDITVNESFITGESEAVYKKEGDTLLSGSFIESGSAYARADRIAEETYAARLSKMAKYFKRPNSEIMTTLKKVIKLVSIIIIPIGAVVFYNQYSGLHSEPRQALVQTVAAVLGMIPEGLMLLTSTVFAVAVVRLSKKKILVQELYCIETLARVDVLCLDKTGTITSGKMAVINDISFYVNYDTDNIILSIVNASGDRNETAAALRERYSDGKLLPVKKAYPFNSRYKYSGAYIEDRGFFAIGAAEFMIGEEYPEFLIHARRLSLKYRVLLLARSDSLPDENGALPHDMEPFAFICLADEIRDGAKGTLEYFSEQGVKIKIISGDAPETVSAVCKKIGLSGWGEYVDVSELSYEELIWAAGRYTIFGRVTPEQKRTIIKALKEKGHTVAMTGDGVNDTLALKEADCSIALASGSDAARSISQLVLLDSSFDCVPDIVYEGRRSINNLERSSALYLTKTIYTTLLAVLFLFFNAPYPFIPIHLTLIGALTIGTPSFFLALEPNKSIVKKGFLRRILVKTVPAAASMLACVISLIVLKEIFSLEHSEYSTLCVICVGFSAFLLLFKVSYPMNVFRASLFSLMAGGFALAVIFLKDVFSLYSLSSLGAVLMLCVMGMSLLLFTVLQTVFIKYIEKRMD